MSQSTTSPNAMGGGEPSASQGAGARTGKSIDNARLQTESPKKRASESGMKEVSHAQCPAMCLRFEGRRSFEKDIAGQEKCICSDLTGM